MDKLILVYQNPAVIKEVRRQVDGVSSVIIDIEKLEEQIYYQLASYFNECENRSFLRIRKIIGREIKNAKLRNRKQNVISFSDLSQKDFGESGEREYEPVDVLADVSKTVVSKLTVTEIKKALSSLATTERDTIILNELCEGYKDTQIAKTLASLFGGKLNTHRQYVIRFRTKCKDKLGLDFAA